ncbi:hypothetical protein Tco_0595658 [Tanacetum coccineum]
MLAICLTHASRTLFSGSWAEGKEAPRVYENHIGEKAGRDSKELGEVFVPERQKWKDTKGEGYTPLWRGIGLYPDDRLKKKAMCALPFLERDQFQEGTDRRALDRSERIRDIKVGSVQDGVKRKHSVDSHAVESRYDNEEVALRSSIQGSQSRREVALAMLNQLFPFLTGGEPSSLLSSRLSMPQEENCPLWRGIGLYPDNRLKKKAMCALPFLESLYFIDMSDTILEYTIQLLSGLALPAALQIIASWRVARLRNLTIHNYTEKVDESVTNTIKEQLSERVITPLFTNNNMVLPPENNAYDVIDALVPGLGLDGGYSSGYGSSGKARILMRVPYCYPNEDELPTDPVQDPFQPGCSIKGLSQKPERMIELKPCLPREKMNDRLLKILTKALIALQRRKPLILPEGLPCMLK